MSEYAIIDGPYVPLNSASPTQYFPYLSSIGIDAAKLDWKPISEILGEDVSTSPVNALAAEDVHEDVDDGEDISTMSLLMQAKKLVADGLHVPLSSVEIIIRA
ncbi:hypothetical protein ASG60_20790 [Methylobacterium sp. Leaf469]|nr:hypothetical protein ASG60_20790 [Methylobacterium sp. Leaf469]